MLDETEEFKSYTTFPDYTIKGKQDSTYLGRFTFEMLKNFEGLTRVFTILARGYMWETETPDTDRAYRALCAWCSLPEDIKPKKKKIGQDETCFAGLHGEFPELVTETGEGWFYRHVHNIIDTVLEKDDKVYPTGLGSVSILEAGFDEEWCKRVMQFQASLYSRGAKGWVLRFEDIVAEAKVEGPLKNKDFDLPDEILERIEDYYPKVTKRWRDKVVPVVIKYYLANKPEDSDWVIMPVDNFNAYFGSTMFDRKYLRFLENTLLIRETYAGICRYKVIMDESWTKARIIEWE